VVNPKSSFLFWHSGQSGCLVCGVIRYAPDSACVSFSDDIGYILSYKVYIRACSAYDFAMFLGFDGAISQDIESHRGVV
jgi:hypothetical protein